MHQTLHTFLLIISLAFSIHAQSSFHVSNNYATKQGGIDKEIAPSVILRNLTNETLQIRWEISKDNLSDGWTAVVCDHQCYTNLINEKTFELKPGEVLKDFKVSFRPNGKGGMGNYDIILYDVDDRKSTEQTVTFSASANSALMSSNTEIKDGNAPKIFPNPATQYIYLDDKSQHVKYIEVYNVVGSKMQRMTVNNEKERYDVSALPRGIYMIRMLDKQGHIVRTQRISKYNP